MEGKPHQPIALSRGTPCIVVAPFAVLLGCLIVRALDAFDAPLAHSGERGAVLDRHVGPLPLLSNDVVRLARRLALVQAQGTPVNLVFATRKFRVARRWPLFTQPLTPLAGFAHLRRE